MCMGGKDESFIRQCAVWFICAVSGVLKVMDNKPLTNLEQHCA